MQTKRQYRGSVQQGVVRPNVVGVSLVEWSGGLVGKNVSNIFFYQRRTSAYAPKIEQTEKPKLYIEP